MAKYLMLGKYSVEAIKGIKTERTKKAAEIFKRQGGKIISMYALVGPYDLALIVDLPGNIALMKASVALARLSGITFFSSPAITVEEFDRALA
ncbi:MAG: GYD domain-containing protein [Candidatus Omnitrophica bacterium]|nr:GYD domain-containing protein [Candidatus Omnitrophota bacterium]